MTVGRQPALSRSAHVDTFCRDHLPPPEQWPTFLLDPPELQYGERLNCATALLDDTVERLGPARPGLVSAEGVELTYGELLAQVDATAHVLTDELGVVPGQRVLLRGPNNPWLVVGWLAVVKAGAVAVTTMPLLRAHELRTIVEMAEVELALCDHRFTDEVPTGVRVVPYGGVAADDLATRAARYPESFSAVDTAADDVVLLAFTSGTTGRPKATMHFHRDVLAIADTFARSVVQLRPDDIVVGTPPLAFTFGLGGLLVFPMRVGAAMLMVEKATPTELAELIATTRATVCFTAPTGYRAILRAGVADRLGSLRRAVSAGEHLPRTTWEAFHARTGIRLIDGIGSTEMLHVFIASADDDIRPGATGRVVPGYRAVILDADGQEAPRGTPGRLAVQGPTGCRYLSDERQQIYVQDGWNITGDTFVQDTDGYFTFQARSDDMIVSSGYNIAGREVEEVLQTHPAVGECVVVGLPDEARGQIVAAFVVLAEPAQGVETLRQELQDFVKQVVAPYKYPRRVEFVEALPRTSTGKVQRFALRAGYRSDRTG